MRRKRVVVVLSDSIGSGSTKVSIPYSRRLKKSLTERDGNYWNVYNWSIGGLHANHLVQMWSANIAGASTYGDVGKKYLVFHAGVNDLANATDDEGSCLTEALSVADNYQTIIDDINGYGDDWHGLLGTPPHVGASYSMTAARRSGFATHANSLMNLLRAKSYGSHCTFLDFADWSERAAGDDYLSEAASGTFTANGVEYPKLDYLSPGAGLIDDELHTNDNWHDQIADILLTYIN